MQSPSQKQVIERKRKRKNIKGKQIESEISLRSLSSSGSGPSQLDYIRANSESATAMLLDVIVFSLILFMIIPS